MSRGPRTPPKGEWNLPDDQAERTTALEALGTKHAAEKSNALTPPQYDPRRFFAKEALTEDEERDRADASTYFAARTQEAHRLREIREAEKLADQTENTIAAEAAKIERRHEIAEAAKHRAKRTAARQARRANR
jgi:hypothetical protein